MKPRFNRPRRGHFIVLEGVDGAGTTTQQGRLAEKLAALGLKVYRTREPSDGPLGKLIRAGLGGAFPLPSGEGFSPHTLAELFAADRVWHLENEVLPKLEEGFTVLSDRYLFSSLAYQGPALERYDHALGLERVAALNAGLPSADVTLFLRVSPEVAAARRAARGGPALQIEAVQFQRIVHGGYERALALYGEREHAFAVDGELPLEDVTAACLSHLKQRHVLGCDTCHGSRERPQPFFPEGMPPPPAVDFCNDFTSRPLTAQALTDFGNQIRASALKPPFVQPAVEPCSTCGFRP